MFQTVDVGTPERAEFENLSDCVEVEEDEWSDRNFLPSATDTEGSQDRQVDLYVFLFFIKLITYFLL